jgi:hypothetical protein
MRRNFVLPSDSMKIVTHDCRTDETKFRYRSPLYDIALLSTFMSKTKKSLNSTIFDEYLTKPEEVPVKEEEKNAKDTRLFSGSSLTMNQNLDSFLTSFTKKTNEEGPTKKM